MIKTKETGLLEKINATPNGLSNASPEQTAGEKLAMLRKPSRKPDPSDGQIVVAVNARGYSASELADSRNGLIGLLHSCMNRMSSADPALCKLGMKIADHLRYGFTRGAARNDLGLDTADEDMCRAFMAGLIGAFATTKGPVDLDAVRHGIASFIHSHPAFAGVVKKDGWKPPFGKHTIYRSMPAPAPRKSNSKR